MSSVPYEVVNAKTSVEQFYEGPRRTSGFLCSHCIAQSTALYQFSFANDSPQFPDAERDPVQRLSLSFATAVVVTAGSTFVSGRMAKLERVFHENGIHVIGMQESRASNDGRLTGAHSEIFTAAGEGTTKSLREGWRMLSLLLLRTPRECSPPISACSSEDTLRCNVVVCHAPHNQCSVEERVAFYELVGKVLRPCSSVEG